MNNKSHNPTVDQPPNWWQHPVLAWINLSDFFSDDAITNQVNWQKLTQGQSNHNYKLTLTSDNIKHIYFVQVVNLDNLAMLPQENENHTAQPALDYLANKPSLKSWLVDCFLSTPSVRVFDWVDFQPLAIDWFNPELASSKNLTQAFFACDAFLLSVGDFMTNLHNLEIPLKEHHQPIHLDIRQHLTGYHQLATKRSPQHSEHIGRLLRQSLPLAEEFSPDKLCHNDLSLNNLLWIGEQTQLKVIDWEYACYSDPVMDLAGFLLNFQLNAHQQKSFVDRYSNKTKTVINADKLKNMKQLCQNISALWRFCST